jgi:hypothetical protein
MMANNIIPSRPPVEDLVGGVAEFDIADGGRLVVLANYPNGAHSSEISTERARLTITWEYVMAEPRISLSVQVPIGDAIPRESIEAGTLMELEEAERIRDALNEAIMLRKRWCKPCIERLMRRNAKNGASNRGAAMWSLSSATFSRNLVVCSNWVS